MAPIQPNPSNKAAPASASRARILLKRAGIALAAIALVLTVVFFLLPVWISNQQGRAYVLERINRQLAQPDTTISRYTPQIVIDQWTLSWFHGMDLKNVRIALSDGSNLLTSSRIQTGLTLWDVLWGNYDLRTTSFQDLQLDITRFPDGHTSWDGLLEHLHANFLGSLRAALQVDSGALRLTSVQAGQTVELKVKLEATIASADTPFHILLAASGTKASAPNPVISLNATFPALQSWTRPALPTPARWDVLGDMEFSASQIPTALTCDFLQLDPAWANSFGSVLSNLHFSNHALTALGASNPVLLVMGNDDASIIDARLLLHPLASQSSAAEAPVLSLPSPSHTENYHFQAALHSSAPLTAALQRLNPIFGDLQRVQGLFRIQLLELSLPLSPEALTKATCAARIEFPPLSFAPDHAASTTARPATPPTPSLITQLLTASGTQPPPKTSFQADLTPLSLTISESRIRYPSMLVSIRPQATESRTNALAERRLRFAGSLTVDGAVDLLATVSGNPASTGQGSLGSQSLQVSIRGTINDPVISLAP